MGECEIHPGHDDAAWCVCDGCCGESTCGCYECCEACFMDCCANGEQILHIVDVAEGLELKLESCGFVPKGQLEYVINVWAPKDSKKIRDRLWGGAECPNWLLEEVGKK